MAKIVKTFGLLPLVVAAFVAGHEESSSCVYTFMENTLEKMFKLRTEMDKLERRFGELEESVNYTKFKTPVVAFRTLLTTSISNVQKGTVIKFNDVDFNIGNAYKSGVFTAPYSGIYLFSTTLGNPTQTPGELYLKKNGVKVEYNVAGHTAGFNVGDVTTVVKLDTGDTVWVEGSGRITGPYESPGYYSSFSGFLINRI